MKSGLVSVIIPVYNVEKLIDRCMESVVGQTYRNLEIILVDDGSTDRSLEKCYFWKEKDERVTVISKENGGTASARNAGLDAAHGQWIAFVDSDDKIDVCMYEKLIDSAEKNNADIAVCGIGSLDESGEFFDPFKWDYNFKELYSSRDFLNLLYENDRTNGCVVCVWNKIYDAGIWSSLRFTEDYFFEDEDLVNHVYLIPSTISVVNEPLYFYIRNIESKMNISYNIKKWRGIECLYQRAKIFGSNNIEIYPQSLRMYLNLYIENYYKFLKIRESGQSLMKHHYFEILCKNVCKNGLDKDAIRFILFFISPVLYKYFVDYRVKKKAEDK